jgi:acyl-CoA synthetase (AMP-forming)/AMP-acid ligase II
MKNNSQFESPRSHGKSIRNCCCLLTQSNKTFADIYRIVFSRDGVLCETSGSRGLICYTYRDFRAAVDLVSSSLYQRLGADGYVAIYGKNSFEWTVAFWAILKSGNKPFLINMQHPSKTIVSLLDTLGCEAILCTDERLSDLGRQNLRYTDLASGAVSSEPPVFADKIALSTSGTTLNEKICIYTGEVISNQILNAPQIVKAIPSIQSTYEGKLKMLMVLPLYHIFGLEASYLWFLIFGAVFVFPPRSRQMLCSV